MDSMHLTVLGWEEIRGVAVKKSPDKTRIQDLIPTINTTVLIHARLQDGPPFTITFDGEVFWGAIAPFMKDFKPTWDHVYLLGWYDDSGKSHLTSWTGDRPIRSFVVTGADPLNMPLWDAPVPRGVEIHLVPLGRVPKEYAKELGGYHAIGWWTPGVTRKT